MLNTTITQPTGTSYLTVYPQNPRPQASNLNWDGAGDTRPNLVVVPHIASATRGTRDAMATICARNLLAGVLGQPLTACVNPEVEPQRRR